MINRREFIGITTAAGASLALAPELLQAFDQTGKLIQRAIPSSGEMLPVVSFGAAEESDTATMKVILKTLLDHGGRVVDGSHGGGEAVARTAARELGVQDKFYWPSPGALRKADPAAARAALDEMLATFNVPRFDLVMMSTSFNIPAQLAALKEMKKEGRVRHIGVRHLAFPSTSTPFGAFMAYFTFDRGRLFKRAGSTPLPDWADEFDAKTWPQFFLKYVLSHPAVIVARTGTTKAAHMLDNIGGGIGRLPNEATRKRMAALVDSWPVA